MKQKALGLLVAMSVLVASAVPVFAATPKVTVENPDTGYTASTDITATITAEMLGEDVVVTVPALITITASSPKANSYQSGMSTINKVNYSEQGTITAKGVFENTKVMFIGVDSNTNLVNTTDSNLRIKCINNITKLGGFSIAKGSDSNAYISGYSIDQSTVAASHTQSIKFIVLEDDLNSVGTYSGTANYYVAILNAGSSPLEYAELF